MASKKLARKKVGKIEKKNAKSWLAKVANFPTSVRRYQVKLRPLELWNSLQQGGEVVLLDFHKIRCKFLKAVFFYQKFFPYGAFLRFFIGRIFCQLTGVSPYSVSRRLKKKSTATKTDWCLTSAVSNLTE